MGFIISNIMFYLMMIVIVGWWTKFGSEIFYDNIKKSLPKIFDLIYVPLKKPTLLYEYRLNKKLILICGVLWPITISMLFIVAFLYGAWEIIKFFKNDD